LTYTPSVLSDSNHTIRIEAGDQAGNLAIPATTSFKIDASLPDLPPDPGVVAPQLNPAIVTDLKTATGFLYTGENPIQSGVDVETIEVRRAAVIRGKVLDAGGNPLPGVKITILNQPHSCYIERENQVVRETVAVPGTPLVLNYSSERATGRQVNNIIQIPLSGATVPVFLKSIVLKLEVAGQQYVQYFPGKANQSITFTWNGKDGYGGPLRV
jgi:hypothetical protein